VRVLPEREGPEDPVGDDDAENVTLRKAPDVDGPKTPDIEEFSARQHEGVEEGGRKGDVP
jgi:hypothetical protein